MQISLCGAAGEVTGSGFLVETDKARVLVDFGLFQGMWTAEERNRGLSPVDPHRLDAVVLTHAHLDHCGRLPILTAHKFRGKIHGTEATGDCADLILTDAAHLQEADVRRLNRRRQRQGRRALEPLFTQKDVERVSSRFRPLAYDEVREIAEGVWVRLVDAGHLLGSASVELTLQEQGRNRVLVFSGDLGQKNTPLLRDPTPLTQADLVFLESTYGDRDHRSLGETVEELRDILQQANAAGTMVLIPSFAIGRSQQILYHIAELVRSGALPDFPVFLDSPMAIRAAGLYGQYHRLLDQEAQAMDRAGHFPGLKHLEFCETLEQSLQLNQRTGMAVVVAASGMCEGGRILHHLKHHLWRENVAVIMVGYQVQGTLGRRLVEGAREVRVLGQPILVRAAIHTLGGFSGHAGQTELAEWAGALAPCRPRFVLTHGEDGPRDALRRLLENRYGVKAECPGPGEKIRLE